MRRLDKRIGLRMTGLRNNKNLSVEALSEVSGIAEAELKQIEDGDVKATPSQLRVLSEALGVSVQELLPPTPSNQTEPPPAELAELKKLVAELVCETDDVELLTGLVSILRAEQSTPSKGE